MAQSPTVMAFRKRCASYGYTEIRIYRLPEYHDTYLVMAKEPLGGNLIKVELSSSQMYRAFR